MLPLLLFSVIFVVIIHLLCQTLYYLKKIHAVQNLHYSLYEEFCFPGYGAMLSGESQPTFRSNTS
jgi:hypothetical protein